MKRTKFFVLLGLCGSLWGSTQTLNLAYPEYVVLGIDPTSTLTSTEPWHIREYFSSGYIENTGVTLKIHLQGNRKASSKWRVSLDSDAALDATGYNGSTRMSTTIEGTSNNTYFYKSSLFFDVDYNKGFSDTFNAPLTIWILQGRPLSGGTTHIVDNVGLSLPVNITLTER